MLAMGIEGTAHTISASVLDQEKIYSLESRTFTPEKGGINPREAADFHFSNIIGVLQKAMKDSGFSWKDLQLIGFSKGPGLPPSLKITAVAARSLSLKLNIPIVGVNHPLGHVEIGRRETGAQDPVMLYVSGGNTQIIAHRNGRYRVLGETVDIGIGNLLDKIARDMGHPFPGGPVIEKLAQKGSELLPLPYSVNGMDCSFSGIYTAAKKLLSDGNSQENVAFSVQEYAFAMLVETLERALFISGKRELLLAGGVARNERLKQMITSMARDAGVRVFETPYKYCMDNGAMIGQAALLTYNYSGPQSMEETRIDKTYRIDSVDAPWVEEHEVEYRNRGAESIIEPSHFHSWNTMVKKRKPKSYRVEKLDMEIRKERLRNEITMLWRLHNTGVNAPVVFSVDHEQTAMEMERIDGIQMSGLKEISQTVLEDLAVCIDRMHNSSIIHGDLSMNNILMKKDALYLIDPSMGKISEDINDRAWDLRLLKESLISHFGQESWDTFSRLYAKISQEDAKVVEHLERIESRRRYA